MMVKGVVKGIISNLVIAESLGPVMQNEIALVHLNDVSLKAEVLKIRGRLVFMQVFESTDGLKVGNMVEFTNGLLEITLGPGLLSRNYDGLQNDLDRLTGLFLKKGETSSALDENKSWHFCPYVSSGVEVSAGEWIGEVDENGLSHKIMVPFKLQGTYRITWIATEGAYAITDVLAKAVSSDGEEFEFTMIQKWPIKRAIDVHQNKLRPFKLFSTGIRCLDSLHPMLEGGCGFVPGAFGTGKTVLLHAISKQAEADVVVIAACGERANEVVEIFVEFPELIDTHTGKKLVERSVIVANTSNMPVAAREASVYTAMTIAEYYRTMGHRVLIIADSTSRWAQALREMSNRMEELPGQDAFPVDLSAIISNFYSRSGYVKLKNNKTGSITFIGTVSPAGGNFKEPVTESTQKVARCYYALDQMRADRKRYPAINPIESYSKYVEYPEFLEYVKHEISEDWILQINHLKSILQRGKEIQEQINILGDDGVSIDYHVLFWKSEFIDYVYLQQDGYDKIDAITPIERQCFMLRLIMEVVKAEFVFEDYNEVASCFKQISYQCKQLNYLVFPSTDFQRQLSAFQKLLSEYNITLSSSLYI